MSKFVPFYLVGGLLAISAGSWSMGPTGSRYLSAGQWLAGSSLWADLVASTNHRLFDLAVLACMGVILGNGFMRTWKHERRRLLAMGVVMLLEPCRSTSSVICCRSVGPALIVRTIKKEGSRDRLLFSCVPSATVVVAK